MNKRELSLTLLVVVGLVFTGFTFVNRTTYDCVQPMFSIQSSCSLFGGSCISTHSTAGFNGLWDNFKSIIIEKDESGVTLRCSPNCSIRIDGKTLHYHNLDSASYLEGNADQ